VQSTSPTPAFFAGLLGFGYVYVGRLGSAVAIIAFGVTLFAIVAWTRLILSPWALYALGAVSLLLFLLQVIHPVLIAAREPNAPRKRYNRWWFYVLWLLVSQLGLEAVLVSRAEVFGYETFGTPSGSMAPTLEPGDYFVVDSWRYSSARPSIGDVVVYQDVTRSNVTLVKRVVGVPGDRVEVRAGHLYRNAEPVVEPYLSPAMQEDRSYAALTLAAGQYYVLGDNRANSLDSRFHGPVSGNNIRGRVEYIWFSSASWQRFPARIAGGT